MKQWFQDFADEIRWRIEQTTSYTRDKLKYGFIILGLIAVFGLVQDCVNGSKHS